MQFEFFLCRIHSLHFLSEALVLSKHPQCVSASASEEPDLQNSPSKGTQSYDFNYDPSNYVDVSQTCVYVSLILEFTAALSTSAVAGLNVFQAELKLSFYSFIPQMSLECLPCFKHCITGVITMNEAQIPGHVEDSLLKKTDNKQDK